MLPDVAFDLRLEHGLCVGIRLPGPPESIGALGERALVAEERAFAASLTPARRRSWVGGRVALREALTRAGIDASATLPDERGAPRLPSGVVGSVSHKEDLAVALVAKGVARVGVDVELDARAKVDIAARVLADDERAELAELDENARAREVLLRFSAKEAIYKALDPFVHRYVGFKEVSVTPLADGGSRVRARLRAADGPLAIEVRWLRWEGFVLTTARVERGC